MAVRVVKQPKPKYVLVLESSSSMSKLDLWKWVSKAVHKFIRNDLPEQSKVAVVTFSNDSSIEHNLGMYNIFLYLCIYLVMDWVFRIGKNLLNHVFSIFCFHTHTK